MIEGDGQSTALPWKLGYLEGPSHTYICRQLPATGQVGTVPSLLAAVGGGYPSLGACYRLAPDFQALALCPCPCSALQQKNLGEIEGSLLRLMKEK